jgi:hypothetical protein
MQHSGLAQSSKHADTFTDGTVSPWVFFQKVMAMKVSGDLYTLAPLQRKNKKYHGYKNWTSNVGLPRFPNHTHEVFLLTEIFPSKKFQCSKKKI